MTHIFPEAAGEDFYTSVTCKQTCLWPESKLIDVIDNVIIMRMVVISQKAHVAKTNSGFNNFEWLEGLLLLSD